MSDKAMPLGKKFKVRLTITPEETGTPVDMLGFTFTSGKNGHTTLNAQYSNIPIKHGSRSMTGRQPKKHGKKGISKPSRT